MQPTFSGNNHRGFIAETLAISLIAVFALLPLSTDSAKASSENSELSIIVLGDAAMTISPIPRPNPSKPEAMPDFESGPMNTPIVLRPASNDRVGSSAFALSSMSLCLTDCDLFTSVSPIALCDTNCGIFGSVSPIIGKTLLQDQGSWTVDQSTGIVTFTPALNWFGTSTIRYVMFDLAGNRVESTLTVEAPPIQGRPNTELADTGLNRDPAPLGVAALLTAIAVLLRRLRFRGDESQAPTL